MRLLNRPLEISEADIADLQRRGVAESLVLDYKRELGDPSDRNVKHELLKDASAMANAAGGIIVCGVEEDASGCAASLPGLRITAPDALHNQLDGILTGNLDPPIPGLVHRAIPRSDGMYFYIVRVPASSQAPHMITTRTSKPRFYLRINTTNLPMNAAQIKEVALRHGIGEERALRFVADRLSRNTRRDEPWICLHIVPLFREPYALDITDSTVTERLVDLGLASGTPYHSVHGFTVENQREDYREHVLFCRDGAVEWFQSGSALMTEYNRARVLNGKATEALLLSVVSKIAEAEISGLPEPPVMLHLHTQGTRMSRIFGTDGLVAGRACEESVIVPEHTLVYEWGDDLERAMKHVFDVIWQAYGFSGSPSYDSDGQRI